MNVRLEPVSRVGDQMRLYLDGLGNFNVTLIGGF